MSSRFDSFDDEYDPLQQGRWIARCNKVMRGKPAKKSFAELEQALLALPGKRLIPGGLSQDGEVCAVGALGLYKGREQGLSFGAALAAVPEDYDGPTETADYGESLGLTFTLAWLIAEYNDEDCARMTPEQRYTAVLAWARHKQATTP